MQTYISYALASSMVATAADALKVGLLSDVHLHLRYDSEWGPKM